MRQVKRWRYYCDFCKKSGSSKYHMTVHEAHCTNNPNRACRMCYHMSEVPAPIQELVKALGSGNAEGMKRLRELSNNCPSCMLAAIRQSGLMVPPDYGPDGYSVEPVEYEGSWHEFDFKAEKERFWKDIDGY